ncbi:MAG: SH3 domain-containing protein [Thermoguttaceae bacterium]
MRPVAALCLISCCLAAARAEGETKFPFKAVVAGDEVCLRSGPGQSYYPTDRLKRGQTVEVYRQDAAGWCAVRPVEGSFTWVAAEDLKPTDGGLAVVVEDGAQARIGSNLSDDQSAVQVRLREGEVVTTIEPPHNTGPQEQRWYKIAPPSGEFRWVAAKDLDVEPLRAHAEVMPPQTTAAPSRSKPSRRPLSAREFQSEYELLQLELSAMILEDAATWSLSEFRERANWLLDEAPTAVERGQARLLANRIARFEQVRQRQEAVLAMRDDPARRERFVAGLPSRSDRERSGAMFETDGRFDGVGRLTEVQRRKPGTPRYALTNDRGEVLCYVTPTPGVNPREYLGRRVGVVGSRANIIEPRASHITAHRIMPLDGTMMR